MCFVQETSSVGNLDQINREAATLFQRNELAPGSLCGWASDSAPLRYRESPGKRDNAIKLTRHLEHNRTHTAQSHYKLGATTCVVTSPRHDGVPTNLAMRSWSALVARRTDRPWSCSTDSLTGDSIWWRHQMETFSALLPICAGNSPVTGEFPTQRPVTRNLDIFFDLRWNKR